MRTTNASSVIVATILSLAIGAMLLLPSQAKGAPTGFPLKVSANRRYLIDRNNRPFLVAGDSPQSLFVNLNLAQAAHYFTDRRAHGFNTVWINLVCDTYTGGRSNGATFDGIKPFDGHIEGGSDLDHYDLSKPDPAYFGRCDQMLALADKDGLLVILDPIETGGWLTVMHNNGVAACRKFGRYVGNRFRRFDNIVWISGNDYAHWGGADNVDVEAVAEGIRTADPGALQTIEGDFESSSLDNPAWAPLVSIDSVYTYFTPYAPILKEYDRPDHEPILLIEANYEFENYRHYPLDSGTNAYVLRKQEYWSLLSGAAGQVYGNHFTWTFAPGWQSRLDTPGALQMTYLGALFNGVRWYDLASDQNHTLLTAGYGTFQPRGSDFANDYAAAASTPDGRLALVYIPTPRSVSVDMSKMSGAVDARWFDPSSGIYRTVDGSPFPDTGSRSFTTPGKNSDGDGDWVLVLTAARSASRAR